MRCLECLARRYPESYKESRELGNSNPILAAAHRESNKSQPFDHYCECAVSLPQCHQETWMDRRSADRSHRSRPATPNRYSDRHIRAIAAPMISNCLIESRSRLQSPSPPHGELPGSNCSSPDRDSVL